MVITLTGATGFIGRKLLERFPPELNSLLVMARRNPQFNSLIHFVRWDATREEPSSEALNRCEAVVHLAGEPVAQRWTDEAKQRIRDSRVLGTRNLVNGLRKARFRPSVLVCASASGYYGDRGAGILDETAPQGSGFLAGVCRDWEREADAAAELGIRVVKLRIGIVLGKGGGALAKMTPPFRMGVGGRLGSGRQWMSWIHVDDLADLIRFSIENQALLGAVNAASPYPVTNEEFTGILGKVLRRPAFLPVPALSLKLMYGEMARILFDSARMTPRAALVAGFRFGHAHLEAALRSVLS